MHVVIATDSIGSLSSAQAGAAIAAGWPAAQTTVIPSGEAGAGFAQAIADQLGGEVRLLAGDRVVTCVEAQKTLVVTLEAVAEVGRGIDYSASSLELGQVLRQAIESAESHPLTIIIDLSAARTHDGGAGLLAGLGATADGPLDLGVAGLGQLRGVDLAPVRKLLGDAQLIGIVGADQLAQPLLGLRGITSLKGREVEVDPARLLATDAALEQFAGLIGPEAAVAPGAGACGGTGLAIAALGGRICSGPALAGELGGLARAAGRADLVVTGCSVFDFASRGGGVLAEAAQIAEQTLRPCIAIAGEVLIGGREMRTMGIESAYPIRESTLDAPTGGDISAEELTAAVRRIARSWSW